MYKKLFIASLLVNVLLIAGAIWAGVELMHVAHTFTRIAGERWRTQFEILTESKHGVVFLGDSITEGGHWSELFRSAEVLNRGIGGDTTQDVLDRVEQIYALQPARLFLMIGVNDLNQGVAIETTLANYRELFDGFARNLPETRVFVQSVLPVSARWRTGAKNADIDRLNEFLRAESTARGYTFVDLHAQFSDGSGALRAELSNDGIHLLGTGYMLWRDSIRALVSG
jgi:lysophospholipase L1-like esterase